jgi:hypothetical protein
MPDLPEIDLMGYMPDPIEYVQIIPIQRDNAIWFHIIEKDTGRELLLDYLTALKMAGQLAYLVGRVLQDVGKAELDQMGPHEVEGRMRAADDPNDERWQRETYRRPKN